MTKISASAVRLWELDSDKKPARQLAACELDSVNSFVDIYPNMVETDPTKYNPIMLSSPNTIESFNVTLIGDVATRFEFDTDRNYAIEVWSPIKNISSYDQLDQWFYFAIPAMQRQIASKQVRVSVANDDGIFGIIKVDEMFVLNENFDPVPFDNAHSLITREQFPGICFRTNHTGHQWGWGPTPIIYDDEGATTLDRKLPPEIMCLQMVTDMSPADAFECSKLWV